MQVICDCPVTRNISVTFTQVTPAPVNGYTVTWKESGSSSPAFTKVVTSSPATLENVPVCKDIEVNVSVECGSNQTTTVSHLTYRTCATTITGSHLGTGYYMYPSYLLELTDSIGTITLNYNTVDKPNKFTVYKGSTPIATSGTTLTSGWVGTASYAGPWGATLSNGNTGSITFQKTDSNCYYSLVVEAFTNVSFTDTFSVAIACPTVTTPTLGIAQTSCSSGNGVYRITGSPGTTLSLSIQSTEYVSNYSNTSCAGISLAYTSSVGTSASGISNAITATGVAVAGNNNSIYSSMTIPSIGYIDIFTTALVYNSVIDASSGTLTIFQVNGVSQSITQAICEQSTTGTFNCNNVTQYNTYQATKYSCGSCAMVSAAVNDQYISFPVGITPVPGRYYVPDSTASEYGTYVYLLGATGIVTGFSGLIMQNVSSTTCAGACSLSNPL